MKDLREMIVAYEEMRDRMLSDAESLARRQFTLRSEKNGRMEDVSDEWAATLRVRAKELDDIVKACQRIELT